MYVSYLPSLVRILCLRKLKRRFWKDGSLCKRSCHANVSTWVQISRSHWSQFSYREILVQIEAPGTSKSGKGSTYSNNNKQTNRVFGKCEHIGIVSSDTHTYDRIHTNHAHFTDLTGVNPNITYTPIKN